MRWSFVIGCSFWLPKSGSTKQRRGALEGEARREITCLGPFTLCRCVADVFNWIYNILFQPISDKILFLMQCDPHRPTARMEEN